MSDTSELPETQEPQHLPDYPHTGIGRRSEYDRVTADLICQLIADGMTITDVCKKPGMPSKPTLTRWRTRIPAFDAAVVRARQLGMESWADRLVEIADDDTFDTLADGKPNHANVQRARLQIDTRWRLMQAVASQVYGDRVEVQHSGNVAHTVSMDDRERMRRLATFLLEDQAAGALIEGQSEPVPPASQDMGSDAGMPGAQTLHDDGNHGPTSHVTRHAMPDDL